MDGTVGKAIRVRLSSARTARDVMSYTYQIGKWQSAYVREKCFLL